MITNRMLGKLEIERTMRNSSHVGRLLILTLLLALIPSAVQQLSVAQPRDRRVATEPTATPIPSPATSPAALRSVAPTRTAPNTLAELRMRIEEIVRQP